VHEAYATVERKLREIVAEAAGDVVSEEAGAVALARHAERTGLINSDTARAVEGLSVMRNLAMHRGDGHLTPEQALEYLALADGALFALRRPRNKAKG
jgi:hypothetical protein